MVAYRGGTDVIDGKVAGRTFRAVPFEILVQLWQEWIDLKIPIADRSVRELRTGVGDTFLKPSDKNTAFSGLNFGTDSGQPDPLESVYLKFQLNATLYFDKDKWSLDRFIQKVVNGDVNTDEIRHFRNHVFNQFEKDDLPVRKTLACYAKKKVPTRPVVLGLQEYYENYLMKEVKGVMRSKTMTDVHKVSIVRHAIENDLCVDIKLKPGADVQISKDFSQLAATNSAPSRLQWLLDLAKKHAIKSLQKAERAVIAYDKKKKPSAASPGLPLANAQINVNHSTDEISEMGTATGGTPTAVAAGSAEKENQNEPEVEGVSDSEDEGTKKRPSNLTPGTPKKKARVDQENSVASASASSTRSARARKPSIKAVEAAQGFK